MSYVWPFQARFDSRWDLKGISGSVEHICRRHVNEARPEPKHVVGHGTSNMDKRVELDQRDGNASVLNVRCTASPSRIPGSKQKS